MPQTLYEAAQQYRAAGLSFFPTKDKQPAFQLLPTRLDQKTGKQKASWLDYQERQPTQMEIDRWYKNGAATEIAFACGPSSHGNHPGAGLFVIDVDNPSIVDAYREMCGAAWSRVLVERTRRGGVHLAMICDAADELRNVKLALRPNPEYVAWKKRAKDDVDPRADNQKAKFLCDIETRGNGGYVCAFPTPNYVLEQGSYGNVPFVGVDDVVLPLLEAARRFTHVRVDPSGLLAERAKDSAKEEDFSIGKQVIDAYRKRHSIIDTLSRYGYTNIGGARWKRPGGKSGSVLAESGAEIAVFFSSSDPMAATPGGGTKDWPVHDSFSMFMQYEHNGDMKDALIAAGEELNISFNTSDYSDKKKQMAVSGEIAYTKGTEGNLAIFLVDDLLSARLLESQGVATLYIPNGTQEMGKWTRLALSFDQRYAWFKDVDGRKELLAMAADALMIGCLWSAHELMERRAGDQDAFQLDVFNYVQAATRPTIEASGLR